MDVAGLAPLRGVFIEVGAELGISGRARCASEIFGEQEHLLNQVLANERVALLEPEANRFAVEDFVFNGVAIDVLRLLRRQLRHLGAGGLGVLERLEACAREADVTRRRWPWSEGEDEPTQDEKLNEAAACDGASPVRLVRDRHRRPIKHTAHRKVTGARQRRSRRRCVTAKRRREVGACPRGERNHARAASADVRPELRGRGVADPCRPEAFEHFARTAADARGKGADGLAPVWQSAASGAPANQVSRPRSQGFEEAHPRQVFRERQSTPRQQGHRSRPAARSPRHRWGPSGPSP